MYLHMYFLNVCLVLRRVSFKGAGLISFVQHYISVHSAQHLVGAGVGIQGPPFSQEIM